MSKGVEEVQRWPLHPQPQTGEALTSWLRRIGNLYGISNIVQLVSELHPDGAGSDLDRDIPDAAARMLAARSTVALDQLQQMSLSGWVPWLLDSTDPEECDFDTYVHQLSVLIPPQLSKGDRPRRAPTEPGWLPWVTDTPNDRVCPVCIGAGDADTVIGVKLIWQLSLVASCPEHRCRLEPCHVVPGQIVFWDRSVCALGKDLRPTPVHSTVTALDHRTTAALAEGSVLLPRARVHAGLWFRMLRTLIDEICIPLSKAGTYARDLRLIWECADDRPPRALTRPFEYLNRADQSRILAGAAAAITLIEDGTITAAGTHGDLLSPYPADAVFAGIPFPPSVPAPPAHTDTASSAWEKLPALIDAVVAAARENADTARSLHAFILLGARTDQQIRKIDDTFNELGIDIGNRDR
ncbi:TniQ family protein [Rhodococcus qingshengii]|uniref:TniQ family protein n=1 Tax=Actinomycetes TaxID=1760 RepID=UPI000BB305CF|nr:MULTISPECIES: TniQ family protein [Rhodococcus]MBW4818101.1 TniQ family protein [Rhodococcus qingshengii]MCJ0906012.1 TniQ family protein [Rhodococcus sp. ARC_M6]PBI91110.1 TniQ [Rhodococcus erythropolis]